MTKQVSDGNQAKMFASLQELRADKLVPFTYGPMYVFGKIPFSVMERFVNETGADVHLMFFDFPFEVVALPRRLPNGEPSPYPCRLFALNDGAYDDFRKYLEDVELVDRENRRFGKPYRTAAALLDPFMRVVNVSVPVPEVIDFWTVTTMRGIPVPRTHVETLPYPIFKPGEAEELTRAEFLKRLPRPATAPPAISIVRRPPDPRIVLWGRTRLEQM